MRRIVFRGECAGGSDGLDGGVVVVLVVLRGCDGVLACFVLFLEVGVFDGRGGGGADSAVGGGVEGGVGVCGRRVGVGLL